MVAPNLDRRIVVKVEGEGERVDGRWEPGPAVTYAVWSMRSDKSAALVVAEGGSREDRMRDFVVRYDGRFLVDPGRITVTDSDGLSLSVTGVIEPKGSRRRFLRVEAISVAP